MAALTYAVSSNVKARLFGDTSSATYNNIIGTLCTQVNEYIERKTLRPIGPDTASSYTLDGHSALEDGRLLLFPRGVRTLSAVTVAPYTGATAISIPIGDIILNPNPSTLEPGWPYTEVWMTDIPSGNNTFPYFAPGYGNIVLTGSFGWAAIPQDLVEVAEVAVVRAFNGRQTGQHDTTGVEETGVAMISRLFDIRDLRTIEHYAWKPVFSI